MQLKFASSWIFTTIAVAVDEAGAAGVGDDAADFAVVTSAVACDPPASEAHAPRGAPVVTTQWYQLTVSSCCSQVAAKG